LEGTAYAVEAQVEADHWWFVGRRRLITKLLRRFEVSRVSPVLDIGTGTGSNLRMLQELGFADVTGVDNSEDARRFCHEKGLGSVERGDACSLPFPVASFNLVLATDIIEHVEDDVGALKEISRVLKPGGKAIITVPAITALWGLQDDVSHHKRRYRKAELLAAIAKAGLQAEEAFYFNYLLFVPIWLGRKFIRLFNVSIKSENQLNTPVLNRLLTWIFTIDVKTAPLLSPPFGVSILAVVHQGWAKVAEAESQNGLCQIDL
jgi:SAM-dependent methyltransferase